jgi:hypothetical protein
VVAALRRRKSPDQKNFLPGLGGALGGIRTPNLLIRSQMLYPLSYERLRATPGKNTRASGVGANQAGTVPVTSQARAVRSNGPSCMPSRSRYAAFNPARASGRSVLV